MLNLIQSKLLCSADAALSLQSKNGAMPAGHNNTWNDIDTPIRCTSHFAITFLFAYKITGNNTYKDAAINCFKFLQSKEARPHGYTFYCRDSRKKNYCNGLIGQAWAIESLLYGFECLKDDNLLDLAYNVYKMHDYSFDYGLYRVKEIDGNPKCFDLTLNHQLFFVATGLGLLACGKKDIQEQLESFFSHLPYNMCLSKDGLIHHHVRKGRNFMERSVFDIILSLYRRKISSRSQGFQSFNMFALSLAKKKYPVSSLWHDRLITNLLTKMYNYVSDPKFIKMIYNNPFALAYRMPGVEILFFKRIFSISGSENEFMKLINLQFARHWNEAEGLLSLNTGDPNTLSSRIYEAVYLFE